MNQTVRCYSGFRLAERPVSFHYKGQLHRIRNVLSEMKTEIGYQFQVLTESELQYQLVYDEHQDSWLIRPFSN